LAACEKTRGLLEWVVLTVLVAFTGLAGMFLPSLYFLSIILMPLPVTLLVLRLDARYGILGLAAGGFLMLFAGQEPVSVLVMVIHYGLLGIVFGLLFKNGVSSGKSLLAGVSAAAFLAIISVVLVYALTKENPLVLGQENRRILEEWAAVNRQMRGFEGMLPERQAELYENLINIFELLIPGQLVVASATSAAITYFLNRFVLERLLKYRLPLLPAFSAIYLPWYSIWGLIAGLGLLLLGDQFALPLLSKTGKNILFVLSNVYLVFGLSVVAYFSGKVKLALPLKVIFLFLAFSYLPFSIAILLLLGAADPLVNFRRLPALKN